jgi:hypothetical protein
MLCLCLAPATSEQSLDELSEGHESSPKDKFADPLHNALVSIQVWNRHVLAKEPTDNSVIGLARSSFFIEDNRRTSIASDDNFLIFWNNTQ